jgi:hypothetical protein
MTETDFITYTPIFILIIFGLFWLVRYVITFRWNRHKARTVSKWEAEGIEFRRGPRGGQFGGLESMGMKRVIRGIGYVALTGHDLRVTRAVPSAAWCISYKQIKSVTIQPSFLGEAGKSPFIVVRFVKDGQADKLGFKVKEVEEWAEDLAEAAGVALKDQR